ncbi:dipeptidyl-peptidase 3 family protein [Labilibaculum euxinus]|uniref:Zn-dependent hydrolase n=1 Tax=Labilibaculum euxinus TaxID=2686357 RepID=A0A7M4D4V6_9BACT|nr:Zn-dependent hydrolase [Labilibaculum euxinus]MUP37685.1 Zn-dependent hydrolase [Labilibaculum euxinus]MVB06890.1 Zn-dependent hydrolase [Labilibaculum euxinus]
MKKIASITLLLAMSIGFVACNEKPAKKTEVSPIQKLVDQYAEFELTTDISKLTKKEKKMLPILMEVADIMEELFWKDAIGDKAEFLGALTDPAAVAYSKINYGPWDRLNDNLPFIDGFGAKPKGANFYPGDMTQEEFDAIPDEMKTDWYTKIERDENGELKVVPYHVVYKEQIKKAADLLLKASELAEDAGLKKYLELRSTALLTDDYLASDLAWMDMKTNTLDFVVGPIETYEDALYGYKASHSGQILVKDKVWSEKLSKFASLLPRLQEGLPVPAKYKAEKANANADMNVYDVIYYAGDCNAGSKNIAINLPNDPRVHAQKGSRKLQLKNAMKAKFDKILVPISDLLMDESQRKNVTFDAFFENVMFHEVAHGLGIKYTLKDHESVRKALKDTYTSIEEGKADILGLYMITQMAEWGELDADKLMDNYVTFMAGIFRSVRFGAASAHGKANMIRFYFFEEQGAFTRNAETGTYKVDFGKMKAAINELGKQILIVQGDGDYEAAKQMIADRGFIREDLQKDLDRINSAGIPKDVVFKQGMNVLGL